MIRGEEADSIEPLQLRLLEDAADELARLDTVCTRSPAGVPLVCWLAALSRLDPDPATTLRQLVAATADSIHEPSVAAAVLGWRTFVSSEERRVRGGAPLSLSRWSSVAPGLATYPERERLEALWKEAPGTRPILLRALDSAALMPELPSSEVSAGLLLCAAGRVANLRFLPFAGVEATERALAVQAWRDGAPEGWRRAGLAAAARSARGLREAIGRLDAERTDTETALAALGRGGISARRAMDYLRASLATTVPGLSDALDLSRPAASDALERLAAAGSAIEVTGRARDRVYAWAAALAMVDGVAAA